MLLFQICKTSPCRTVTITLKCSIMIWLARVPSNKNKNKVLQVFWGGISYHLLSHGVWSKGEATFSFILSLFRSQNKILLLLLLLLSSFSPTYSSTFGELGTNPMSWELLRNMCTQKQCTSAKGSCTDLVISLLINQLSTAKILCHSVPKALLLSGKFRLTSREGGNAVIKEGKSEDYPDWD